jgi:YidC/Oxa1 family membrane protein insertase
LDGLTQFWNTFLVWPIEGALLALTELTGSAGLAIIAFTVIVRTVVLPLGIAQARSQKAMWALQPKIRELQKKYPNDRQKFAVEQMNLYREHGVHPLAGCFPMLIQMPIWFALYSALINLSNCAAHPETVECARYADRNIAPFNAGFLWIQNLGAPSMPDFQNPATWGLLILPILTAITQWIVQKMSTLPTTDPQQQQMARMMEFMPLMFLVFSFQVASGLVLYWVVSNVYSIIQQRFTLGWGTLPYLGNKEPPGEDPASKNEQGTRASRSARQGGPSSAGRRRRRK